MTWKQIQLSNGMPYWIDLENAQRWLDTTLAASESRYTPNTQAARAGVAGSRDQLMLVFNAWSWLGQLFTSLNIKPIFSTRYLEQFSMAYGGTQDQVAKAPFDESVLVVAVPSDAGWMTKKTADIAAGGNSATRALLQRQASEYVVRTWLSTDAKVKENCVHSAVVFSCKSPSGKTYKDLANNPLIRGAAVSGGPCDDPNQWTCCQWIGTATLFPPLLWSLDLAHAIAVGIQQDGLQNTVDAAVRRAAAQNQVPSLFWGRPSDVAQPLRTPMVTVPGSSTATGPTPMVTPVGTTPMVTPVGPGPMVVPDNAATATGTTPDAVIPIPSRVSPMHMPAMPGTHLMPAPTPTPAFHLIPANAPQPQPDPANATGTPRSPDPANTTGALTMMALSDLHLTCDQWKALTADQKETATRAAFVAKYKMPMADASVASFITGIDRICMQPSPSTPGNNTPMATTMLVTLEDLKLSCAQWNALNAGQKQGAVQGAFLEKYKMNQPVDSVASFVAAIDTGCPASTGPAPGPAPGPDGWQVPSTPAQILTALQMDCPTWLKLTPASKASVLKQLYAAHGVNPTDAMITSVVGTLDHCSIAATQGTPSASWWNTTTPLLIGGAALAGLIWYSFSKGGMEEDVLDAGEMIPALSTEPVAESVTESETVSE